MDTPDLAPVTSAQVWRYGATCADVRPSETTPAHHAQRQRNLESPSGLSITHDLLAEEVPVALEYNGISHATLLATPSDLEDLARGFSMTEGIIRTPADIYDIELTPNDHGITVQITIASACMDTLKRRRRSLAGTTGCGLCGLESLQDVEVNLAPVVTHPAGVTPDTLLRAVSALRANQPLHLQTGATHAAGWANLNGDLVAVREDVGRHNALDKLIGQLQGIPSFQVNEGFLVMSSRASFEIVQKAAAAGIGCVIAVSAPTAYAVRKAQALNMLLVGFTRHSRFTTYAHPEHLYSKDIPL